MTNHINLDETDVKSELEEGEQYTVTFTLRSDDHHPDRGSGARVLSYRDATGAWLNVTLWGDSAPTDLYEADYENGTVYTLTNLNFAINEYSGSTYYNLTATSNTELREGAGHADESGSKPTGNEMGESDTSPAVDDDLKTNIEDAFSEVSESATAQTGHILTTFRSTTPLDPLTVHEYSLKGTGDYQPEDSQEALRDTFRARREIHEQAARTPVIAVEDKFALTAVAKLPTNDMGLSNFEVVYKGTRTLDYTQYKDREVAKDFIDASLRRLLASDYRVHGIDTVLSNQPVVEADNFRLHERWNLSLSVSDAGIVHLSVDFRHKVVSDYTLDMLDESEIYPWMRVSVTYKDSGKGAFVDELRAETSTDPLKDLTNRSIVEYHEDAGRISEAQLDTIRQADRPVVQVTKQGNRNTETYPQELLALQGHPENLAEFAPTFNRRYQQKTRKSAQKCFDRATRFVKNLPPVIPLGGGTSLSFESTPLSGDDTYELTRLFDPKANVLQFGDGAMGDHPNNIRYNKVYRPPEDFTVCLLHPEGGGAVEDWTAFLDALDDMGAPPEAVDRYTYDPLASASMVYSELLATLPDDHEYSAALAILPKESTLRDLGQSTGSEMYHGQKQALSEKYMDSQMAYPDTLTNRYSKPNAALGLIAAAGGIPFTAEDAMPGDVGLFIGLDVSHRFPKHSDDRVHLAASTTSIYGDGTIFGYTSTTAQAGETISSQRLKKIVLQSISGYRTVHGEYPPHVVLHRDGFMYEDLTDVRELLEEMGITYDIVEIRKQSPARVLKVDEGVASVPDKGIAAINREEQRAIVNTFGSPESQADSKNTGLPQPIQVQRKHGETDIETLAAQVYLLSQSHIGAMNSTTRLPITTSYADKASEAAAEGHLPETNQLRQKVGFL